MTVLCAETRGWISTRFQQQLDRLHIASQYSQDKCWYWYITNLGIRTCKKVRSFKFIQRGKTTLGEMEYRHSKGKPSGRFLLNNSEALKINKSIISPSVAELPVLHTLVLTAAWHIISCNHDKAYHLMIYY